jgi:hypothetical protein
VIEHGHDALHEPVPQRLDDVARGAAASPATGDGAEPDQIETIGAPSPRARSIEAR